MACRSTREKRDLLRVVRTAGGTVSLDPSGRLNGRGAYVDRDPVCIDLALDRDLLAKALEIPIPAEFRSELLAAAGGGAAGAALTGGARGQE